MTKILDCHEVAPKVQLLAMTELFFLDGCFASLTRNDKFRRDSANLAQNLRFCVN
ncbi:hypothetical protein [Helicobacter sp. 23-1045]